MSVLRQIWYLSAIYLNFLSSGLATGNDISEKTHSSTYTTWGGIFTIIGYITSSLLMDTIGRQSTYVLGILPGLINCILVNFTYAEIELLRIALNGLSSGITTILGLVIIGEYASPKHRSVFLNVTTVCLFAGQAISKTLTGYIQWRTIVNISLILRMLSLGITLTWPKSPYWLAVEGRYDECKASFDKFRGTDDEAKMEKKDLMNNNFQATTFTEQIFRFSKIFVEKDFRKSVILVVFGAILVEVSGKSYMSICAADIMASMSHEAPSNNPYIGTVIALSLVFSCVLLNVSRNRKVLSTTGFASVIAMLLGSVYLFLATHNIIALSRSWLWILLMAHLVFSNMGATTIPYTLIGEVFSLRHKAVGILVAGLITSTISWAVMKMASYLFASFQLYVVLGVFGLLMTTSLLVLLFILPETSGRTLLEIEEYFKNGWFCEDECDDGERLTEA